MNPQFIAIANDPTLIPGVHHYCDEWCDYCPVTTRCLAFRCTSEFRTQRGRAPADPTFINFEEAADFTREVAATEGTRTDQLDALMASPISQSGVEASDPLASLAWDYAVCASELMMPTWRAILALSAGSSGPAPDEIVMWYHLRIYMTVFRALIARTQAGADGSEEAVGCARLALVSVQRSRSAVGLLRTDRNGGAVDGLVARLDALEHGLDERFPAARRFVRVGLDCAVA